MDTHRRRLADPATVHISVRTQSGTREDTATRDNRLFLKAIIVAFVVGFRVIAKSRCLQTHSAQAHFGRFET